MLSERAKSGKFSINFRARNWAEGAFCMRSAQFLVALRSLGKHTKPPATQARLGLKGLTEISLQLFQLVLYV